MGKLLFRTVRKGNNTTPRSLDDSSTVNKNMEHEEGYCVRPIMSQTYEINMYRYWKIFSVITIGITILSIVCFLYLAFVDDTIYYPSELKYTEIFKTGLIMISCLSVFWMICGGFYLLHKYMEKTKYIWGRERIYIQTLGKKEKTIEYEEVANYIVKEKIRVRNGRFEFKYSTGMIPVYTWGDEPMPPEFYQFVNEKCKTNIPQISKEDNIVVRNTGRGWTFYAWGGLPLFFMSIFVGVIGAIDAYEVGQESLKLGKDFVFWMFRIENIFMDLCFLCVLIGIVQKIGYAIHAKKHFERHKDTIKVSLFR